MYSVCSEFYVQYAALHESYSSRVYMWTNCKEIYFSSVRNLYKDIAYTLTLYIPVSKSIYENKKSEKVLLIIDIFVPIICRR